ncbi:MAG: ABC transporter permease [Acidobacteriota bacterium]
MSAPHGGRTRTWRLYRRSAPGKVGLAVVSLLLLVGFFAPILASSLPLLCRYDGKLYAPAAKDLFAANLPWGRKLVKQSPPFNLVTFDFGRRNKPERGDWAIATPVPHGPTRTSSDILQPPTPAHYLGTDEVGRDVLARMIHGARVSMLVGFVAVGISAAIGIVLGSIAGYAGGAADVSISRLVEIVQCFPVFFLILSIMAWLSPSIWNVMIVIGITSWTSIGRYVRGEFLRLRNVDFSLAAVALGAGPRRIVFRHILPNALAPVFPPITFGIASAILTESALSWLGFGVQPPAPSWGNILRTAFESIFTTSHMIYPPCIAIFLAVLGYNLVGDTLRDVLDPRLSGSR